MCALVFQKGEKYNNYCVNNTNYNILNLIINDLALSIHDGLYNSCYYHNSMYSNFDFTLFDSNIYLH